MIEIDDKIISNDVLGKKFVCDLAKCKGACCVEGDAGAPLLDEEQALLQKIYEKVKPYMRKEGVDVVEKEGVAVIDSDGELTTNLVNNKECSFVIYEKGIAKCSIEKAHNDGVINFRKPISCHLFPIRIKEYRDFEAINYEKIKICKPACECGSKLKIPLFVFLKKPLIRKYGETWYEELLKANSLLKKQDN